MRKAMMNKLAGEGKLPSSHPYPPAGDIDAWSRRWRSHRPSSLSRSKKTTRRVCISIHDCGFDPFEDVWTHTSCLVRGRRPLAQDSSTRGLGYCTVHGLNLGAAMLCKYPGYPDWPCRVYDPLDSDKEIQSTRPKKGDFVLVYFFGSQDLGWIMPMDLRPFDPNYVPKSAGKQWNLARSEANCFLRAMNPSMKQESASSIKPLSESSFVMNAQHRQKKRRKVVSEDEEEEEDFDKKPTPMARSPAIKREKKDQNSADYTIETKKENGPFRSISRKQKKEETERSDIAGKGKRAMKNTVEDEPSEHSKRRKASVIEDDGFSDSSSSSLSGLSSISDISNLSLSSDPELQQWKLKWQKKHRSDKRARSATKVRAFERRAQTNAHDSTKTSRAGLSDKRQPSREELSDRHQRSQAELSGRHHCIGGGSSELCVQKPVNPSPPKLTPQEEAKIATRRTEALERMKRQANRNEGDGPALPRVGRRVEFEDLAAVFTVKKKQNLPDRSRKTERSGPFVYQPAALHKNLAVHRVILAASSRRREPFPQTIHPPSQSTVSTVETAPVYFDMEPVTYVPTQYSPSGQYDLPGPKVTLEDYHMDHGRSPLTATRRSEASSAAAEQARKMKMEVERARQLERLRRRQEVHSVPSWRAKETDVDIQIRPYGSMI